MMLGKGRGFNSAFKGLKESGIGRLWFGRGLL